MGVSSADILYNYQEQASNRNVFGVCGDEGKGVERDVRGEAKTKEMRHQMTKVLGMVQLLLNKKVIPNEMEMTVQVDATSV